MMKDYQKMKSQEINHASIKIPEMILWKIDNQ